MADVTGRSEKKVVDGYKDNLPKGRKYPKNSSKFLNCMNKAHWKKKSSKDLFSGGNSEVRNPLSCVRTSIVSVHESTIGSEKKYKK